MFKLFTPYALMRLEQTHRAQCSRSLIEAVDTRSLYSMISLLLFDVIMFIYSVFFSSLLYAHDKEAKKISKKMCSRSYFN